MLNTHFAGVMRSTTVLLIVAALVACRDAAPPTGLAPSTRVASITQGAADAPALETFYGPERFTRGKGGPETFTRQIETAHFEAPFVLHVRSGDAVGTNRVSSATVRLDGVTVLGPSAFNQQQGEWSIPVRLGTSATLSVSLASAPGSYLDVWIEGQRSGTPFCSDGASDASAALQQAIADTPNGGTVLICAGTHHFTEVRLNKPITIEGAGPAKPVLDFGGACCGLRIDGAVGGPVHIRGLEFRNGKYQEVLISGASDGVTIEGSDFYPGIQSPGNPWGGYTGVAVGNATSVVIQNSTFTGGDIGVNVGNSSVTILGNTFTGQDIAIHAGDKSRVRLERNVISDCGPNMCIGTFDSDAVGGTMDILDNSIQVDFARATGNGIQLAMGTYRIEGNTISGVGGSQDPNSDQSWPFRNAGIAVQGNTILSGNHISGASTGMSFGEAGTVASGSDNTVTNVGAVLYVYKSTAVTLHRNDFSNYGSAIQYINQAGSVSLTCNWWGSANGPQPQPGGVAPGTYAPWATQPIAGTSTSCDPAASVMAMRVCPTAVIGGAMNAATFSQAYDVVAPGGTIAFCAGTHSVAGAWIGKPLNVTSESAMATLDAGRANNAFWIYSETSSGAVSISRLRFSGGASSQIAVGHYNGPVGIIANEFNPPNVGVDGNDFATLTVENNRFTGGKVGVNIYSPTRPSVPMLRGNTFVNQDDATIGLHGALATPVAIENNSIHGCGPFWCVFSEVAVRAVGNTAQIDMARPISASVFFISNQRGGTSIVTDNVITGVGSGGTDRSARESYPIGSYGIHVVGAGRVERNTITNAYNGIGATPGSLVGSDNVITHTFAPFGAGGDPQTSTIAMHRNDLSDYVMPFSNWYAYSSIDLKCNYWGSAAGPVNLQGDSTWFSPFAIQPIANQPTVTCP